MTQQVALFAGRPPGPEMENCSERESYSLAAGLALGLVMLGKGKVVTGLADLNIADELYQYMVGGHKRPLVSAPDRPSARVRCVLVL